jgi:glutathione peroxidase
MKIPATLVAIALLAGHASASGDRAMSSYDLTANTLDGAPKKLSDEKGKVLVVLGFPSNDFGGQEPGTAAEIKTFCEKKCHLTFPMFAKVKTKGEGQSRVYAFLVAKDGAPKWNFHKYAVGEDEQVTASFSSSVKPDSDELKSAIEAALKL